MATRSIPIVSWRPDAIAILSLVPTPSVVATRIGSLKPVAFRSNNAPKPPSPASLPRRAVDFASGFSASTSAAPASISTPASRYWSRWFWLLMASSPGVGYDLSAGGGARQAPREHTVSEAVCNDAEARFPARDGGISADAPGPCPDPVGSGLHRIERCRGRDGAERGASARYRPRRR